MVEVRWGFGQSFQLSYLAWIILEELIRLDARETSQTVAFVRVFVMIHVIFQTKVQLKIQKLATSIMTWAVNGSKAFGKRRTDDDRPSSFLRL